MLQQLRHLEPFAGLDWAVLQSISRHARIIDLPARRPLKSPGKRLTGRYYLLSGRLRSGRGSDAVVIKASPQPVFPGFDNIVTVTSVRLLQVDVEPIAFLFDPAELPDIADEDGSEDWQVRFLRSHMLSSLSTLRWQQILRALVPMPVQQGERLIRRGDTAECCYILARGRAGVWRRRSMLRRLVPGDFFGEDALLSGRRRNACVRMCSDGVVMALEERHFRRWLSDALVETADEACDGISNQAFARLRVDAGDDLRQRLAALDPCSAYRVSGPERCARLGVFLLRQRGIRAVLD
jgi:CRP-like cAMP-binding protein